MRAGFALQIVAHLPIIATLMRACESGDVLPGDQPFVAIRLGTDGRNWQRGDERSSFGGNAREIRERQVADHRAPRARHTVSDGDACKAAPALAHRGRKRREAQRRRPRDSLTNLRPGRHFNDPAA